MKIKKTEEMNSLCLDCQKEMEIETDIQLCQECMLNYDTDRLWDLHDKGEIDALRFNENEEFKNSFRI